LQKSFFAASGDMITPAFWKLMSQPISVSLYQLELFGELMKERSPKKKPGHDDLKPDDFELWEGEN
jgi:hypothetical protein